MTNAPLRARPKNPSMQDVARLAGVSRTTASFVINNVPNANIPPETQQRVWDAVAQLGYRPNAIAQSLRGNRSNVLGFISDDIATTPFAVDIIRGAQNAAMAAGKVLLLVDTEGDPQVEDRAIRLMNGWQVEGVVYAAAHHRAVRPAFDPQATPVVLVDCFVEDRSIASVVPNEVQGARTATERLLGSGRQRIGFINGPLSFPASLGRLEGYRQALAAHGLAFDAELVRTGDWWQESGYEHARELMQLPDPPTALFCANDWMAMGAYDALKEMGRTIPQDVAVIGFDNREVIAAHMRPALTTIALPYYEMGQWGVEYLLGQNGAAREPVQAVLDCPLVERRSA